MRLMLLVLAAMVLATSSADAACLTANRDGQEAHGRLTAGTFRDAAGRPERAFILQLAEPTCLSGKGPDESVRDVRRLHVFSNSDPVRRQLGRALGKRLIVLGNPFPAMTAHHHAPVVMEVQALRFR